MVLGAGAAAFGGLTTANFTAQSWHGGFWAEKENRFYTNRIFSAEAKTTIYDEAVNAFRTHYDDNGSWQGEYWGKTMLSAIAVQRLTRDEELKTWIRDRALAFVKEFQAENGYLCSYSDPWDFGPNADGSAKFNWNLWGRKYTMWALIEASDMLGRDKTLLAAAMRVMDHEMAQFEERGIAIDKTGFFVGLPTMSVLKPLMLLYRRTRCERYLAFAKKLVAMWEREGNPPPNLIANAFGDKPVHEWYPNPGYWAKGYEMMSCLEGILDYADWTHDRRLVDAVARIAEKLAARELTPLGSVGYFDHFTDASACPNLITELCDAMHWMRLSRDLFLATKEPRHLDRMEAAFFNAFLPGIFRDGKWVAHGTRSHGTRHYTAPHQVGMKYHHCCVDNACRTWEHYVSSTLAMEPAEGMVYVNFYTPGEHWVAAGEERCRVSIGEGYPFEDQVTMEISAGARRTLKFRAPPAFDEFSVNGVTATNGWVTMAYDPKGTGGGVFTAKMTRTPKIHQWKTEKGADPRPWLFEFVDTTPEMKGLARTEGAAYLTYGPLLLAKTSRLGTSREDVLATKGVIDGGWSCTLEPLKAEGVNRAWTATFTKGDESFSVPVCDFASCDEDDLEGCFAIWF